MLIIDNIKNTIKLLDQQINLLLANKQQLILLNNNIQMLSQQILTLNITNKVEYYLPKLLEFNNYLQQVLAFANKFMVKDYQYLLLKKINYSDDFEILNAKLKHLSQFFKLTKDPTINQQPDPQIALQDLAANQELYNKNSKLLADLMMQQISIINNISVAALHLANSRFLSYQELPVTWQKSLSKVAWNNSDLERYKLLEQLNLSNCSYELLTPQFKQLLAEVTLVCRGIFVDEESQYPDLKAYWDHNATLRSAWLNINFIPPQQSRCFLLYHELSQELQDHLRSATVADKLDLNVTWDNGSNEDCDNWIQSLSATIAHSLPLVTLPLVNSYDYLNEHFKQQLSAASAGIRLLLAATNQQDSFACSEYWYKYQDLHKIWFNYYSHTNLVVDPQPTSVLLFSSSSQALSDCASAASSCQKASLNQQSVVLLDEQQGFKLLLLKITSSDTQEIMQYIVGLPNKQANLCIAKKHLLTELDFEEQHIINLFDSTEKITDQDLQASKDYFKKHFIADLRLLGSLSKPAYN